MEIGIDHDDDQINGENGGTMDIKKEPENPSNTLAKEVIEENDEDDPIVEEIPVFLAKSLAKQLFLLQVLKL